MSLIDAIATAWSWTGIIPRAIVAQNALGNVIVTDAAGAYWRVCPEEHACDRIAETPATFQVLWADPVFLADWEQTELIQAAQQRLGIPPDGHCFYLKLPAILGGMYAVENVGVIKQVDLIMRAGEAAS